MILQIQKYYIVCAMQSCNKLLQNYKKYSNFYLYVLGMYLIYKKRISSLYLRNPMNCLQKKNQFN